MKITNLEHAWFFGNLLFWKVSNLQESCKDKRVNTLAIHLSFPVVIILLYLPYVVWVSCKHHSPSPLKTIAYFLSGTLSLVGYYYLKYTLYWNFNSCCSDFLGSRSFSSEWGKRFLVFVWSQYSKLQIRRLTLRF